MAEVKLIIFSGRDRKYGLLTMGWGAKLTGCAGTEGVNGLVILRLQNQCPGVAFPGLTGNWD